MLTNDIFRRCRYIFNLKDQDTLDVCSLGDQNLTIDELKCYLAKEEDTNFKECPERILSSFLDGLIVKHRGKRERKPGEKPRKESPLTNNLILKKIRIALNYKEEDMLKIFDMADFTVSKSEFNAFFRNPNHRNYKACGDQILRNFFRGLTLKLRPED